MSFPPELLNGADDPISYGAPGSTMEYLVKVLTPALANGRISVV